MKLRDLVHRLADQLDCSQEQARAVYDAFVSVTKAALASGEDVKLDGLGVLSPKISSPNQFRPQRESEASSRVIDVSFQQLAISRSELVLLCPVLEELERAERESRKTTVD